MLLNRQKITCCRRRWTIRNLPIWRHYWQARYFLVWGLCGWFHANVGRWELWWFVRYRRLFNFNGNIFYVLIYPREIHHLVRWWGRGYYLICNICRDRGYFGVWRKFGFLFHRLIFRLALDWLFRGRFVWLLREIWSGYVGPCRRYRNGLFLRFYRVWIIRKRWVVFVWIEFYVFWVIRL